MNPDFVRILAALLVSVTGIIAATRLINLHPFFSLLGAAVVFGVISGLPITEIIASIQSGFGLLMQQIGILVVLGCVLGMVLGKSGAMESVSRGILLLVGHKRALLAMVFMGVVVGIPVFCDSGFIILSRLIPVLATKTSVAPASLTLGLSGGLYTTHSLVPPTPGPLAAGSTLGLAEVLGKLMVGGLVVSIPVMVVIYVYARYSGTKILSQFPSTEISEPRSSRIAISPLMIPVCLIAGASFVSVSGPSSALMHGLKLAGQPVVALSIGIALASLIVKKSTADWSAWITDALKDAGIVLLITGAGGSFGSVIKSSQIETHLSPLLSSSETGTALLVLSGWLIAAILKTAQGSTTSAMIIASSLVAPLVVATVDPADLIWLTLAIGGGAMTVSHANDSYFWVVSKFGGLSTQHAFQFFTTLTLLQGLTVLFTTLFLTWLL
jgi:GntP family gluconate:H+ symporter